MKIAEGGVSQRFLIVQAAVVSETLLVIAAYVLSGLFDLSVTITTPDLWITVLGTTVFVAVNWAFGSLAEMFPAAFPALTRLKRELIEPLGEMLSSSVITLIAVLSGFAEELFFRGALAGLLDQMVGPIGSFMLVNVIFAVVHFLGQISRFSAILPYYFLAGAYLSTVTIISGGNLVPAMIVHGVNNWVILNRICRRTQHRN